MLAVARRMPQGMFAASLVFQRAIPDEREDAISRRRERTERGRRHVTHHRLRIPWSRTDHLHGRPICERRRQVWLEPLACPLTWIAGQGDEQPTEDHKVLRLGTAKVPLARGEHLIYFAWDACATPHVSRSCVLWDVGCIQNTQER